MEWIKLSSDREDSPIYKKLEKMGMKHCKEVWLYGTLKHRFGYYPPENKVVKVDRWVSIYLVYGKNIVDFTNDCLFYPTHWMPIEPPVPPNPPKD